MTFSLGIWNYFRNIVLFFALSIPTTFASLVLFILPLGMILNPFVKPLGEFLPEILILMLLFGAGGGVLLAVAHTYAVSHFHPHAGASILRISILYAIMMSSIGAISFSLWFYAGIRTEVLNLIPCSVVYGWVVGYLRITGKTVSNLMVDLAPYTRNAAVFLLITVPAEMATDLVRLSSSSRDFSDFSYLMILYAFSIPHSVLISTLHTRLRSNWRKGSRSEIVRRSMWFALLIALLDVAYAILVLLPLALIGSWVFIIIPSALIYGWVIGRKVAMDAF